MNIFLNRLREYHAKLFSKGVEDQTGILDMFEESETADYEVVELHPISGPLIIKGEVGE